MMKDDCIFCKLANGIFPTRSIYEDEDFNVILDVAPATKGHALILPKHHADNLFELPEETAGKAFVLAKKMSQKMKTVLNCDGFNVLQNNGTVAGQTVFHFHLHLIPRYKNDGQELRMEPTSPAAEELDSIKEMLTK